MVSPTIAALLGVVIHAQLVVPAPRQPLPRPDPAAAVALANTNHTPAGTLASRVLTLAVDVVAARWSPEGENDPEVPIFAFAEPGKAPTTPGPLLRVPLGTYVRVTFRNRTDSALVIGGLRAREYDRGDTVQLAAGASREVRVLMDEAGTFWYWGALHGTTAFDRAWLDSQLNGAIVVDRPGERTDDHVMLMGEWFHPYDQRSRQFESSMLINGKGYPNTERLTFAQGDSVRFRVINTMGFSHPMHLHGFYYRIEGHGSSRVPPARQHLSNTDLLEPGQSVILSFMASTPGNWIFHCHFAFHVGEEASISGAPSDAAAAAALAQAPAHAMAGHDMRGLVVRMSVTPSPTYAPPSMANARNIRLLVQTQPDRLPGAMPAIGFALQRGDTVPPRDRVTLPAPVLELVRNQPVRITVQNNLREPTSVHWHGLEIESYPDGVPHLSGMGDQIYTQIAPGEAFVAEFVPPRSGTFPYHSHLNDRSQMLSGMYGAIIVSDRPRDLAHDHLIVTGGGGAVVEHAIESPYALVNGSRSPAPLRLTAGETHRLRFVTIHPDWEVGYTLRNDSTVARWRPVAKDGADLPELLRTLRPANAVMGPGETADFEFTPPAPGEWRIEIGSRFAGWRIVLPVVVEARAPAKP